MKYKEISVREAQNIMLDILVEFDRICNKNNLDYFLDWGTLLGAIRHKGFIPWDDDLDVSMPRKDFEKFKLIAKEELDEKYFLQTPETDDKYKYFYIPMKIRHNKSKYIELVESGDEEFNNGIYIDIFPIDKLPRGKVNYKLQVLYKFIIERAIILEKNINELSIKRKVIYPIIYFFINVLSIKNRQGIERFFRNKCKSYDNLYWSGIDLYLKQVYKKEDLFPLKEIEFEGKKFKSVNNPEEVLRSMYGDFMKMPAESERFSHAKSIQILYDDEMEICK